MDKVVPKHVYGVKPSSFDHRDFKFAAISQPVAKLPVHVDMRPMMPPVYDQGRIGSCTSMGIAAAYEYDLKKQGLKDFLPSRLFIYYNERVIENDVNNDAGAQIRDGIKSIATTGICEDVLWPYDESKFTVKPTQEAYNDALKHKAVKYYNVPIIEHELKQALAQGFPVVAGIMIYESFESEHVADTGYVSMPNPREQLLGGHCILIVGYNDANNHLIVRNSWGTEWGDKGYFYLPYGYINPALMSDLWVVNAITSD